MRAQNGAKWATGGNTTSGTEFLGTLTPQPLIFRTNNTVRGLFDQNGNFQLNSLSGQGSGIILFDNNGIFSPLPFNNDANSFLNGSGTFSPINFSGSGWTQTYGGIFYNGTGGVGIGVNTLNPNFKLQVQGNLQVTGTVFTSGVVISNQIVSDTATVGRITSTTTTVTGTSTVAGNLGVGTNNPGAKLDVVGDVRVSGVSTINKIQTTRITPLPGDSEIHFGDSSIIYNVNANNIYGSLHTSYKGMGIGLGAFGRGLYSSALGNIVNAKGQSSVAIGYRVETDPNAFNAITIGSSNTYVLTNTIPSSLMIGFNSDAPTLFVGPSSGQQGSTGNVGIGTNLNLQSKLTVFGKSTDVIFSAGSPGHDSPFTFLVNGDGKVGINTGTNIGANYELPGRLVLDVAGDIRTFQASNSSNYLRMGFDGGNSILDNFGQGDLMINWYSGKNVIIGGGTGTNVNLAVCGEVKSKSLKVRVNWCDFVFEKKYKRMSILDKELYYTEFKHLPYVETQDKIEKEGLDVGNTMAGMMQNVEENTMDISDLYKMILELKKENEIQKKENEILKAKIENLEKTK